MLTMIKKRFYYIPLVLVGTFAISCLRANYWALTENGNISVEGSIRDQAGQALHDVKLIVSKYTIIGYGKSKKRYETFQVSNSFKVSAKNVHSVILRFEKQGYHPGEVRFSYKGNEKRKDIVISLEEIGKVANLKRLYDGDLIVSPTGRLKAVDITSIKTQKAKVIKFQDVREARLFTKHGIYIDVPLTKEGSKIKVRKTIIKSKEKMFADKTVRAPETVTLHMCDPKDGFAMAKIKKQSDKNLQYHPPNRQMQVAPEKGYVNSVVLKSTGEYYYFYIKIGDHYGKGEIKSFSPYTNYNGGKEVNLPISLYINSEPGSRNVNSGK